MENKKIFMRDMTWMEYVERLKTDIIFLPIGSTEQHGPHLPLGTDAYQIERVAAMVAEKVDAVVAPTVCYGYKSQPYSGGGQLFPTTSLSGQTLMMVVKDILLEFIRHGAKKIAVFDGHFENSWFLTEAIDLALKEYGKNDVRIIKDCFVGLMDMSLTEIIWPDGFPGLDLEHAGLLETSFMLYMYPDLVQTDKIEYLPPVVFPKYEVFPLYEGQVPACGCLADPSRGSAEFGKMMLDNIVENHVKAMHEAFDDWNPEDK